MKEINAKIVADSINDQGNRITTYLLTYPRYIHSELMTHRMFSRNSASSRAIPFNKMIKMVEEDPFIPIAWQKDHHGMSGDTYLIDLGGYLKGSWLRAKDDAINNAKILNSMDVTKQIANRVLETYMWHSVLVTATEYDNFFELRCPQYQFDGGIPYKSKKDAMKSLKISPESIRHERGYWRKKNTSQAEIHIQALAESMWDVMNESTPTELKAGEWHIPFGDQFNMDSLVHTLNSYDDGERTEEEFYEKINDLKVKISIARCARLSYMTFDNKIDYDKDLKLHDMLLKSKHMSPFEHCAKTMDSIEYAGHSISTGDLDPFNENNKESFGWCRNFKGFIQYRHLIETNN